MKTLPAGLRSFLFGAASMVDIMPVRRRPFLGRTDAEAIAADWRAVGDDLRQVLDNEIRRTVKQR